MPRRNRHPTDGRARTAVASPGDSPPEGGPPKTPFPGNPRPPAFAPSRPSARQPCRPAPKPARAAARPAGGVRRRQSPLPHAPPPGLPPKRHPACRPPRAPPGGPPARRGEKHHPRKLGEGKREFLVNFATFYATPTPPGCGSRKPAIPDLGLCREVPPPIPSQEPIRA